MAEQKDTIEQQEEKVRELERKAEKLHRDARIASDASFRERRRLEQRKACESGEKGGGET